MMTATEAQHHRYHQSTWSSSQLCWIRYVSSPTWYLSQSTSPSLSSSSSSRMMTVPTTSTSTEPRSPCPAASASGGEAKWRCATACQEGMEQRRGRVDQQQQHEPTRTTTPQATPVGWTTGARGCVCAVRFHPGPWLLTTSSPVQDGVCAVNKIDSVQGGRERKRERDSKSG